MTPIEINEKIRSIKEKEFGDVYKLPIPNCPKWAESISDAFGLFEEMPEGVTIGQGFDAMWWVEEHDDYLEKQDTYNIYLKTIAKAETAPLAICLAWLKFKGVEV